MADTNAVQSHIEEGTATAPLQAPGRRLWAMFLAWLKVTAGLVNPWAAVARQPQRADGSPVDAPIYRFPTPGFGFVTVQVALMGNLVLEVVDLQVRYDHAESRWAWSWPGRKGADGRVYRGIFCHSAMLVAAIDEMVARDSTGWEIPPRQGPSNLRPLSPNDPTPF